MAQSLNYAIEGGECDSNPDLLCWYGLRYDFETAQTVCPEGWHLPSVEEWKVLETVDSHLLELIFANRDFYWWSTDVNYYIWGGGGLTVQIANDRGVDNQRKSRDLYTILSKRKKSILTLP